LRAELAAELPKSKPSVDPKLLNPILADGTRAELTWSAESGLWRAKRDLADAVGKTPQEALDNLSARVGSNTGAGIRQLEQDLAFEHGILAETRIGSGGSITAVSNPRDLWLYGKWAAPIHTYATRWPIAGRIFNDAVNRRVVQDELRAGWQHIVDTTRHKLSAEQRIELGEALNSFIRGEDLPAGMSGQVAEHFGIWRKQLTLDREALQNLLDLPADWGIDAYFMHVFVGKWQVAGPSGTLTRAAQRAAQGEEAGFFNSFKEAMAFAQDALAKNPDLNITVRPRNWVWQNDTATQMGFKAYQRLVKHAEEALSLSRDDVVELLRGVTKPKAGKKFFGHAMRREANIGGFIADPTEAAEFYAHGLSRKLAFHDFRQTSINALDAAVGPNGRPFVQEYPVLYDAMKQYIERVNGTPTSLERIWHNMIDWAMAPQRGGTLPTVMQEFTQTTLRRNPFGLPAIRKLESMWRLGYSPLSAFVNMSQTYVNTASKIGYGPTAEAAAQLARASRLGTKFDPAYAAVIDQRLIEMGVEYAVPLSAMGSAAKDLHKLGWWHPLYMFNKIETVNRSIAGLAGYNRAIKQGLTHEEAILAGRQFSNEVNFIYSIEDLPLLLSGPAGQTLGQFKPFLVNELHFIAGLRGAEIPRFIVNLTTAGGIGALASLPGLNLADVLAGDIVGERPSEFVKRKAPRAARGVLGLLGFDAEQSLALNSIMAGRTFAGGADNSAVSEIIDLSLGPGAKDLITLLTDVAPSLVQTGVAKTVGAPPNAPLSLRDKARVWRQLMPTQARRVTDAYRIARDGVVRQPTTGREIFTPPNVGRETALTLLGFRSVERSEADRERFTLGRIARQRATTRATFVRRILDAQEVGDHAKARRLRLEAREAGYIVTGDMLKSGRRERAKTTAEKALDRLPRRDRRDLERKTKSTLPGLNR
jgi:hypothetical protein